MSESDAEALARRNEASELWRATFKSARGYGVFDLVEAADKALVAFWDAFGVGELPGYQVARRRLGWDETTEGKDAA